MKKQQLVLLSWMIDKAPVSSGLNRIWNTMKEQQSRQRSQSPEAKAEFLDLPESRLCGE